MRGSVLCVVLILTVFCGRALAHPQNQPQTQPQTMALLTGDQKTITPGYPVGNIAMGHPQICDYKVMPGRKDVLLIAGGEGYTTLIIWDQKGVKRDEIAIEVVSRELARLRADLTELLRAYPQVQVRALGNRMTIVGTVETPAELQAIRALADADRNVVCLVKVAGQAAPEPVRSPATPLTPPPPQAAPAQAPQAAPTPAPRPSLPAGVATPVPLPTGAEPLPPAVAPPAVRPAPQPPAPPRPQMPNPAASAMPSRSTPPPASARTVEYVLELFASPPNAPPPDVLGPQGASLFKATVSATDGVMARQFISAGNLAPQAGGTAGSQISGLSIGLRPQAGPEGSIRTSVVVDTNLPLGPVASKPGSDTPWVRAELEFSVKAGETHYVTEQQLVSPAGRRLPITPSGGGSGWGTMLGAGVGAAAGAIPASGGGQAVAQFVPGLSGLFRGRGSSGPKDAAKAKDEKTLVIAITPFFAAAISPSPAVPPR